MRRFALVLAALVLALTATGCGKEAAPTHSAASFTCPTDNTRTLPKARFVADVGLAFGSFHHWIWKPYRAGKLAKGADHRLINIGKAGVAAALTAHLMKNARENVQADPTLCNAIGEPIAKLSDLVSNLKSKLVHGDFATLTTVAGAVTSLSSLMGQHGLPVKETFQQ